MNAASLDKVSHHQGCKILLYWRCIVCGNLAYIEERLQYHSINADFGPYLLDCKG